MFLLLSLGFAKVFGLLTDSSLVLPDEDMSVSISSFNSFFDSFRIFEFDSLNFTDEFSENKSAGFSLNSTEVLILLLDQLSFKMAIKLVEPGLDCRGRKKLQ